MGKSQSLAWEIRTRSLRCSVGSSESTSSDVKIFAAADEARRPILSIEILCYS